jgi:hypothetical protein
MFTRDIPLSLLFLWANLEIALATASLISNLEPVRRECYSGPLFCPACPTVSTENPTTICNNIVGRPQRCYCQADLCKTYVQLGGRTTFVLSNNAPSLIDVTNFSCAWTLPYSKSLSPHIVLVEELVAQPNRPVHFRNGNESFPVRGKMVRYLDQSLNTTFYATGLPGSTFRATIFQGISLFFYFVSLAHLKDSALSLMARSN